MKKSSLLKSNISRIPLGNKKGALGPAPTLLDWLAYIVLIMAIILAMIVFSIESAKLREGARVVSVSNEKGYLMLNMLRSNVSNSNIAELISKWYINQDINDRDVLIGNISEIINFVYEGNHDWEMEVGDKPLGTQSLFGKGVSLAKRRAMDMVEIDIPVSYSPDAIFLNLKLKIYLTTVREGSWCWEIGSKSCSTKDKLCICKLDGFSVKWTGCVECEKGCEPVNKVCSGKNIVTEGARCYIPWRDRCVDANRLCKCDGFKWQNCETCPRGCDQVGNRCR